MEDISEQLRNVRTMEDIVNLLMVLFTNLNNQNEMYYDMFLNPVPMDLELERYDENGQLVTVTLPNVAKMRISIYSGEVDPNGTQVAAQGALYINTATYDLFYKGFGIDSYGWILLWSARNLDYLSPIGDASRLKNLNMNSATLGTLAVERGGTGANAITGLVKGNGTDPFTAADDGFDYLGPSSMVGIICYYPIYDTSLPNAGIPSGWLRCDGYDGYLKADYPRLAAKLGNKFGGSVTTFGVPNCIDLYIRGWDGNTAGVTKAGQVGKHQHTLTGTTDVESEHTHDRGTMNITGYIAPRTGGIEAASGALYAVGSSSHVHADIQGASASIGFNAANAWTGRTGTTEHSHTLSGYTAYNEVGETDKNEVDHITMVPIIKY